MLFYGLVKQTAIFCCFCITTAFLEEKRFQEGLNINKDKGLLEFDLLMVFAPFTLHVEGQDSSKTATESILKRVRKMKPGTFTFNRIDIKNKGRIIGIFQLARY